MKKLILIVFISSFWACKDVEKLENVDSKIWKNDKMACKNERKNMAQFIVNQKEKLKGLGQNAIMKLLGKPDYQELQARNQRTYIYFYEKGEPCEKPNNVTHYANLSTSKIVKIRFNATDMVNEVIMQ
ncbi:MAG: hypothetical protein EAZ85_13055 [Bacteroidetes bacterium]|nr:MAG: hypothetical protein EAZ85_13055 [Bacteroidota bacterium]TAG86275.1 MAG: hypothetical protein EAZ20_13120 [Bacteroidota bacterium]